MKNKEISPQILIDMAYEVVDQEYIEKIKNGLIKQNRYFTELEFLTILKRLFDQSKTILTKGTILYRSRIYNNVDKTQKRVGDFHKGQFEGFDEKGSFVNEEAEWPAFGRMNPSGIRVLYTSSDIRTSARELNPCFNELISVAEIECLEDLKIADLSKIDSKPNDNKQNHYNKYIQEQLSIGYNEKDYIFSQYISSYCANQGFDGIGYRSKFSKKNDGNNKGINYTIFNYKKCKAVSSKLQVVKNTTITLEEVQPLNLL